MDELLFLNSPNKIKIETHMEKSFLKDSFYRADKALFNMIEQNGKILEEYERKKDIMYQSNYEVGNIISFLGGRGKGKTSTMVSFLYNLNKLHMKENEFESLLKAEDGKQRFQFVWIPYIDASMLAKNDYIIEVILAEMWDKFEDEIRSRSGMSNDAHIIQFEKMVKKDFINVYNAYIHYKDKQGKEKENRHFLSASELHEQATSLHLRREFTRLVSDYLNYFSYSAYGDRKKNFFVIAIDDIDMADTNTRGILEEIRMFLSIPQIIIFMTADLDKLHQLCECDYNSMLDLKSDISVSYVGEYLDKVLPINLRIYMPEVRRRDTSLKIKYQLDADDKEEYFDEKATILKFISEKVDLFFDPNRRNRHFLQNNTLRGMQNYFEKMRNIQDDERYYLEWLNEDFIERIVERIKDVEQRYFMKQLLALEHEDINNYIVNYVRSKVKNDKYLQISENNLGQVLLACHLLEVQEAKYIELVDSILMYYSMIFANKNSKVSVGKLIGSNIFGEREYRFFTPDATQDNVVTGFEVRSEILFKITEFGEAAYDKEKVVEIFNKAITDNKEQIYGWICALLYANIIKGLNHRYKLKCEIKENEEGKKKSTSNNDVVEETREKIVSIRLYNNIEKNFYGFWNYSSDFYNKIVSDILHKLLVVLLGEMMDEKKVSIARDELFSVCDVIYKKEFTEKIITEGDRLPLQNIEILYSVGNILEEQILSSSKINEDVMYEMVGRKYKEVYEYLRKVDAYYCKLGVNSTLAEKFIDRFQVKVFLKGNFLKEEQRKYFKQYFYRFYREALSLTKG